MRRTRKLFLAALVCAGFVMVLLLAAVMTTHLMSNRERVKSYIVKLAKQATGGTLAYDRLEISFYPLPYLRARNIHLRRPGAFSLDAHALSVYPRILPMLKGRVSIRRVSLSSPDVKIQMDPESDLLSDRSQSEKKASLAHKIKKNIQGFFNGLAFIDPQSDLIVTSGTIALDFSDGENLQITNLNASVEKDGEEISLTLNGKSEISDAISIRASANVSTMRAEGSASLTDVNVRPLLSRATLPGGLITKDTRATVDTTFTLDGPEHIQGRFDLFFPSLTITRSNPLLAIESIALSGSVDYSPRGLSVSLDYLTSEQPALDLSATATLTPEKGGQRSVVELHAASEQLDVAVAGAVASAIAGELDAVQTATGVARQGQLTDVSYFAGVEWSDHRFKLINMKASGHVSDGRVTIPGILADLENMDGDVVYEDEHVAFTNVSGHFKGATFQKLDAFIDWQQQPTLSIVSPSVQVDLEVFHAWLTSFEGLAKIKDYIESVAGTASVSSLAINGPLADPANWGLKIVGSPEKARLSTPLAPFEINFSGGEITYIAGGEQAIGVKIDFLDGSFVSSFKTKSVLNPESTSWRFDGTLGQATLDWLSTILPIPAHLQIKPPVKLSDVHILTNSGQHFSFTGRMKTAGGVDLFADFSRLPDSWQVRKLQFSDENTNATVALHKTGTLLDLSFSGTIDNQTANRLLRDNRTLFGYLKGDFRIVLDPRTPLNTSFSGKLEGKDLRIRQLFSEPVSLDQFFFEGDGRRLTIAPSRISLMDSQFDVQGLLAHDPKRITYDLDVNTGSIDEALIREIRSFGKKNADSADRQQSSTETIFEGTIRLKAADLSYDGFTWMPVEASIKTRNQQVSIQINQANLCGISTVGELVFSPKGVGARILPLATNVSLQETADCLGYPLVVADVRYDLSGEINLPFTREAPTPFLMGKMEFSSENGRIDSGHVLMKILAILNVTEAFTGGDSDLGVKGFGYSKVYAKAELGGGKLIFNEILLDGNSLKITGQGSIDLTDQGVDIMILAAPFKTVDRIVGKLPVIRYITGGSLISVPLLIEGKISDPSVVPMPASAVGQGLLGIMKRTLKAPFKLVEGAAEGPLLEEDHTLTGP